jgi:hypothetical protein
VFQMLRQCLLLTGRVDNGDRVLSYQIPQGELRCIGFLDP